jgi:hypothetical protein
VKHALEKTNNQRDDENCTGNNLQEKLRFGRHG